MFKFNSKQGQDQFVYHLLGDIKGYFIDIGAMTPIYANNTFVFEQQGWKGLSFEKNKTNKWNRDTKCIIDDVTTLDLEKIFKEEKVPNIIDYLTVDVDSATLKALELIPFDKHQFKILTVEHDYYRNKHDRDKIRAILLSKGYQIYAEDILLHKDRYPFEDWWINPKFFSNDINSSCPKYCNVWWQNIINNFI